MFRLLGTMLVAYAAYKIGEQQAALNQVDWFILNQTALGSGVQATEYVQITQGGIQLTNDINLATPLLFKEANDIKAILRKHNPQLNLKLETTSNSLQTA